MNKPPLITVITVVYNLIKANRAEHFRQCLESVHDQSYKNIEHLVVDGASDDGTVELIREYADKGWIKYVSEKDSGLYEAMNKGANMANGEYLAFLNSDDFYSDLNGIKKCMDKLIETNADFSYAKATLVDKNNNLMTEHLHVETNFADLFTDMPFSHQTMIVKTEVFKKLGMYDLKYKSASDYDFVLKMVFNDCKYVMCDCRLATFRFGGFSIENMDLSHNEVANFYQKHYGKFLPLTIDEAKNIYLSKDLPFKIIINILKYLTPKDQIKLVKYQLGKRQYLKKLKKFIIQAKFKKDEKYLRIFGKDLI